MPDFRYYAVRIAKDEAETAGDEFTEELFIYVPSEEMARTSGNVRLLNKYPELALGDFEVHVSPCRTMCRLRRSLTFISKCLGRATRTGRKFT